MLESSREIYYLMALFLFFIVHYMDGIVNIVYRYPTYIQGTPSIFLLYDIANIFSIIIIIIIKNLQSSQATLCLYELRI